MHASRIQCKIHEGWVLIAGFTGFKRLDTYSVKIAEHDLFPVGVTAYPGSDEGDENTNSAGSGHEHDFGEDLQDSGPHAGETNEQECDSFQEGGCQSFLEGHLAANASVGGAKVRARVRGGAYARQGKNSTLRRRIL